MKWTEFYNTFKTNIFRLTCWYIFIFLFTYLDNPSLSYIQLFFLPTSYYSCLHTRCTFNTQSPDNRNLQAWHKAFRSLITKPLTDYTAPWKRKSSFHVLLQPFMSIGTVLTQRTQGRSLQAWPTQTPIPQGNPGSSCFFSALQDSPRSPHSLVDQRKKKRRYKWETQAHYHIPPLHYLTSCC